MLCFLPHTYRNNLLLSNFRLAKKSLACHAFALIVHCSTPLCTECAVTVQISLRARSERKRRLHSVLTLDVPTAPKARPFLPPYRYFVFDKGSNYRQQWRSLQLWTRCLYCTCYPTDAVWAQQVTPQPSNINNRFFFCHFQSEHGLSVGKKYSQKSLTGFFFFFKRKN